MTGQAALFAWADASASELRRAIREQQCTGPTAGLARGYAQANLIVLPASYADEFAEFCHLNPRPCPLIAQTEPGNPCPADVAPGCDLRTDVPRYRVFRHGILQPDEPLDISDLWRDDFVGFLLGCSFTFEDALTAAGLTPRHVAQSRNVPMFRTALSCAPAGRFRGPLVVSMRPYQAEQVAEVVRITEQFATMHGGPIHVGDPQALGIADLAHPDFGDAVDVRADEIPLFWACGVTPQLALAAAQPEICITHSPGCMFVMDRTDDSFRERG